MNMFLHGYENATIAIGDTFTNPQFAAEGAGLRTFDCVAANPMWNQDNYQEKFYSNDHWARFDAYGTPPSSSADWGWVKHIVASLKEGGRACVVLDTGAASRGSGGKSQNKERTIRAKLIEADLIESVVLLPENLFYNTNSAGILLILQRGKPHERAAHILVVNASAHFSKGRPKNELSEEGVAAVADVMHAWQSRPKLSRILSLDEVRAADYDLGPTRYVDIRDEQESRPVSDILADLLGVRAEQQHGDDRQNALLTRLRSGAATEVDHTSFGAIPSSWPTRLLGECANVQTGVAKGRNLGDSPTIEIPYLRVANVQLGRLDLRDVKSIVLHKSEVNRYLLQDGDILMTEGGDFDKLGRGFIWRSEIRP